MNEPPPDTCPACNSPKLDKCLLGAKAVYECGSMLMAADGEWFPGKACHEPDDS
jgi:hypothetical protein